MSTHTLPTDLFLLLTTDSGRPDSTSYRRQAVAGAAVTDLALRDRLTLGDGRNPEVQVRDTTATGEPELDQALTTIEALPRKRIKAVLAHRSLDLSDVIGDRLVAAGALERKDGLFSTSWPTKNPEVENSLRARLVAAVTGQGEADLHDILLLEFLVALRVAHRILGDDLPGMSRRDLDHAIATVSSQHTVAATLRNLIDEITTTTAAVVTVAASN